MYFLQGLLMGLAYVAPIGVQNLYVINTALTQPRSRALLTALVVIFFDVTLALACFFGTGLIMRQHLWLQLGILLFGSLLVIAIGINLIRDGLHPQSLASSMPSTTGVVTTACVVTWFNPQAIIDGSLMLGAFRASLPPQQGTVFLLGVMTASCLWFTSLSLLISCLRRRISITMLGRINILCGCVIMLYGAKLFLDFARMARP